MSITTSEKVFIDPKDEITFVVERILNSEKERVIVVVPQNSLLLSSIVSIDILFRKIAKSKKVAIIVTEDEYGKNIATKVGFVVVAKVSQINPELWDMTRNRKRDALEKMDAKKKELLSNITNNSEPIETPIVEMKEENGKVEVVGEPEVLTPSPVGLPLEKGESEEQMEVGLPEVLKEEEEGLGEELRMEEEIKDEEGEREIKDYLPTGQAGKLKITNKEQESEEEPEVKQYVKPRREAKIVNLNGIELLSGGDIKNYMEEAESAKIDENLDNENYMTDTDSIIGGRKIKTTNTSSFTGRDFTRAVSGESAIQSFFKKIFKPKRIIDPNERFEGISQQNKKRRNTIIGVVVGILLLSLIGGYVLAFQTSTVDVYLTLKSQDVSTSANIVVNLAATEITYDPITIPGKLITIDSAQITKSATGTADGTSQRGNKAKGVIDIYNVTVTEQVSLAAGTIFTCRDSGKQYKLTQDVILDAAEPGVSSTKSDVPVEAADIGPDYNLTDTSSTANTVFLTAGYTEEQLYGKRQKAIDGGTMESFNSVSQDNYNKLKDLLVPQVKQMASDKIKASVSSGYKIIEGSITYDESKAPDSLPKVGEEAVDKTFNLTVQIGVSAIEVKSEDLVNAMTYILQNTQISDPTSKFVVSDVNDPLITKVDKVDNNYVLTITSQGSVKAQVTIDQMKNDIKGLTIAQAKDYLHFIDYIDSYTITFTPSFVPESLQRVPNDLSRINIKTK